MRTQSLTSLTLISIFTLASCGGSGGSGSGGGGGGSTTINGISEITKTDSAFNVDGKNLTSSISARDGKARIFNQLSHDGATVTPTGIFLDNTEVVMGVNPVLGDKDNSIVGLSSNLEHTTSNAGLSNFVFEGYFSEASYSSSGNPNGINTGTVTVTISASAETARADAPESDLLNGNTAMWDSSQKAFVYEDAYGYGEFYVLGQQDVAGAYGGLTNGGGAVTGTLAGTKTE